MFVELFLLEKNRFLERGTFRSGTFAGKKSS